MLFSVSGFDFFELRATFLSRKRSSLRYPGVSGEWEGRFLFHARLLGPVYHGSIMKADQRQNTIHLDMNTADVIFNLSI